MQPPNQTSHLSTPQSPNSHRPFTNHHHPVCPAAHPPTYSSHSHPGSRHDPPTPPGLPATSQLPSDDSHTHLHLCIHLPATITIQLAIYCPPATTQPPPSQPFTQQWTRHALSPHPLLTHLPLICPSSTSHTPGHWPASHQNLPFIHPTPQPPVCCPLPMNTRSLTPPHPTHPATYSAFTR